MSVWRPLRQVFLTLGVIAVTLLGPGGFLWFCADALLYPTPSPTNLPAECDGLVVLTGGEERIAASLRLLEQHPSLQLLISGVAPHARLRQIIAPHKTSLPPELLSHITLGYRAISTVGNARETAHWAEEHHLRHLAIVTAGYHMRRAMIEFHDLAPGLTLIPYRVQPMMPGSLLHRHNWGILAREYAKLLGALLRAMMHTPQRPYDLTP